MMSTETEGLTAQAREIRDRLVQQSEEADGAVRWHIAEARSDPEYAAHFYAALAALDADPETAKALRKAVRKAKFILEQSGLVEPAQPAGGPTALVETSVSYRAWMTSADGTGCVLFSLARGEKPHMHRYLEVLVEECRGIVSANEQTFSTHDLEATVQSLRDRAKPALYAEVDPDFVRWRIASSVRATRERGFRVPSVLAYWGSVLETAVAMDEHPALRAVPDPPAGADVGVVLYRPPTMGWLYPAGQLQPGIQAMNEVAESKIAMEAHVRDQRMHEAVRKAAAMIFDEQTRERYHLRLLDLALLYHSLGDGECAAEARAAADRIARDEAQSEFAVALFRKSLAFYVQLSKERRAQKEVREP